LVSHKTTSIFAAPERKLFWSHVHKAISEGQEAVNTVTEKAADAADNAQKLANTAAGHAQTAAGHAQRLAGHAVNTGSAILNTQKCYGSAAEQKKFFDLFWAYFDKTTNNAAAPTNKMYITQAHWQYSATSIAVGTKELSCLIKDNQQSKINEKVAAQISKGSFKNLFILEVDNVCDHGPELAAALHSLAEKRLSTPQAKFDDSLPMLAEPHTTNVKAAAAFFLGGFILISATVVAVRKGFPGCRSSVAAHYGTAPMHGEE